MGQRLLIVGALMLSPFGGAEGQVVIPPAEWGGGRLFVLGEEVEPPLQFAGMGMPVLMVNGVQVAPLVCAEAEPTHRGWCGTDETLWLESDSAQRLWDRQEAFIADLVAVSARPIVALGCDYFYCPESGEGQRVLAALRASAYDLAITMGAPREFVTDFRSRQAN